MTVEMDPTLRELILDPTYIVRVVMEEADRQNILDETGNPILAEDYTKIMDDA